MFLVSSNIYNLILNIYIYRDIKKNIKDYHEFHTNPWELKEYYEGERDQYGGGKGKGITTLNS